MAEPDLSKIIGLIMENQGLIEEIQGLVKKSEVAEKDKEDVQPSSVAESRGEDAEEEKIEVREPTYTGDDSSREKRRELLSALKPYLSKQRSDAIDTMLSITEILGMMKAR